MFLAVVRRRCYAEELAVSEAQFLVQTAGEVTESVTFNLGKIVL